MEPRCRRCWVSVCWVSSPPGGMRSPAIRSHSVSCPRSSTWRRWRSGSADSRWCCWCLRPASSGQRVTRFSPWALGSVAVLAVSGSANAWRQLGSLKGITDSSYGRWLVIKLVLVVAVIGVAGFSRRTVHTRDHEASAIVRRSVGVEIAGIALILGATAGLVNSPPPLDTAEIVSVSAVVGSRVAQVELEPAVTGGTEMHVYITSPSGALDPADEITVTAELPAPGHPPVRCRDVRCRRESRDRCQCQPSRAGTVDLRDHRPLRRLRPGGVHGPDPGLRLSRRVGAATGCRIILTV